MKEVQKIQDIPIVLETSTIKTQEPLSDKQYAHIVLSKQSLLNVAQAVKKAKNDLGTRFTQENYEYFILQEKKKEFFRQKRESYFEKINSEKQSIKWTKDLYFKFLTDTFNKRFPNKVLNFSDEETQFFEMLLSYFSRDESGFLRLADSFSETKVRQNFSIDKGIILIGGKGVGKTVLMKLFAMNPYTPYRVISVQEIAKTVEADKLEGVSKYSSLEKVSVYDAENYYFGHKYIGMCIDDMGDKEEKMNLFGNIRNVIDLVIGERYFKDVPANMTFLTTNTEPKDWAVNYDPKTMDRFREMFNVFWHPVKESKRN